MSAIKLSKAQISKIIQPGGSFGSWLASFASKCCYPFSQRQLTWLIQASNLTSSAINKFDRKIGGQRAVRTGKGFYLPQTKI